MKARKLIGWILNIEIIVLVILVVLCAGVQLFGYKPYAVLSGSMEPALHVGSLAYVKTDVDCNGIQKGEVIAFNIDDGKVVTHRTVENDTEAGLITTKGDANDVQDAAPVSYDQVIGTTEYSIPYLGYFLMSFTDNKVIWIVFVVVINLILVSISMLLRKLEEGRENGKNEEYTVQWY